MTLLQRIKTPFAEAVPEGGGWSPSDSRSAGELLQERREELGLDLDSAGAALRIKPAYLAALEHGRTEELPGPTYAIGFVRAYADYLGLDVEEVLSRFKGESAVFDARPDLSFPLALAERSVPGGAMLLVALILALCGYGTWYYLSTGERSRPERVTEAPSALSSPANGAPGTAPAVVAGPPLEGGAGAPARSTLVPGAAIGGAGANPPAAPNPAPPPATAAPPAAAPPAAAPAAAAPAVPTQIATGSAAPSAAAPAPIAANTGAPAPAAVSAGARPGAPAGQPAATLAAAPAATPAAAPALPAGGIRIVIKATADCWIQVRDPEQSIVFSRVLKAGEAYRVPAKTGLSLRTGNAGALEIAVDGKAVPSVGGVGTMRRNVVLDPEALLAGTAVHG